MTSPIGLEVPAAPAGQVAKHSALLAVSAGMVGVLSYLCTLLMAHLLPPEQYTQYAAAQMLVGIVGIVAHALVPLPLAALVRRHARGTGGRRDGMAFAVLVSVVAGLAAGLLTGCDEVDAAAALKRLGVTDADIRLADRYDLLVGPARLPQVLDRAHGPGAL